MDLNESWGPSPSPNADETENKSSARQGMHSNGNVPLGHQSSPSTMAHAAAALSPGYPASLTSPSGSRSDDPAAIHPEEGKEEGMPHRWKVVVCIAVAFVLGKSLSHVFKTSGMQC
jgi:hypothetical protein